VIKRVAALAKEVTLERSEKILIHWFSGNETTAGLLREFPGFAGAFEAKAKKDKKAA